MKYKINWFKYVGLLTAKNIFIDISDKHWIYTLLLGMSMILLSIEVHYD